MSNLEQEVATLFKDFESLRLPHKLNRYRQYQQQLKTLRLLATKLNAKEAAAFDGRLAELEKRLDASVICAISQCAICSQCNDTNNLRSGRSALFTRSRSMAPSYGRANSVLAAEPKIEDVKTITNETIIERQPLAKKNSADAVNGVDKTSEQLTDHNYKGTVKRLSNRFEEETRPAETPNVGYNRTKSQDLTSGGSRPTTMTFSNNNNNSSYKAYKNFLNNYKATQN